VPKEARALDGITVGPGGAGLAQGATAAVRALAAADGHPVALPSAHPPAKSDNSNRDREIIGAVVLAAGLAWAAALLLRRRRRPATGS
jgi:hypothetical protein